jgi:hypothetical protein
MVPDRTAMAKPERARLNSWVSADTVGRLKLWMAGRTDTEGNPLTQQEAVEQLLNAGMNMTPLMPSMPVAAPVLADLPNVDEIAAAVVARLPMMPAARPMPDDVSPGTVGDEDPVMQALGTVYLHVLAVEHMLADEWEQAWVTLDKKGNPQAGAGHQLRQDATEKAQAEMARMTRTARR